MKLKRIFLAGVSVAALAAAGMYPFVAFDWFSQTFDKLADGTIFTGTQGGTTGGSWQTIASGVATVGTIEGRKCIEIDTSKSSASDPAIRFTASQNAPKTIERFEFAICTEPQPWYPAVAAGEKGALVLMDNGGGMLTFGGYVKKGNVTKWITLYGHGFAQHRQEWIDCRAEFDYSGTTPYVTYYAKLDGADYQPLADSDGSTRFFAAGTGAKAIAFEGKGAVGNFTGQGISYDTTENVWKGGAGGNWEDDANWSLGHAPKDGEVAAFNADAVVQRTVAGTVNTVVIRSAAKVKIAESRGFNVESGDVELFGDYTAWGTIIVASKAKLRAQGTFYGIEMGYASTLAVEPTTNVVVTTEPFHLDGVEVTLPSAPATAAEAFELVKGPYGSGGDPLNWQVANWSAAWHGKLDGTSALWVVNDRYSSKVAIWNDGVWGNLASESNWGTDKPGEGRAAQIRYGQAHVNQWDTFPFSRWFEIGVQADKDGEVDMSGGKVLGHAAGAAVVVGTGSGNGLLDIVGGTVRPTDYLWNYALTVGTEPHAAGTVKIRGGALDAAGGGVSIGAEGSAALEICEGRATVGGPFAVGYAGRLDVTGGSLTVSNSVYIGRTTRSETYDVAMTVDGGAVSNVTKGAFCVGSYGGVGSKAVMTLASGEVSAAERFVCGGYRSAQVDVTGGTLTAPEICVGQDFVDANDTAAFNLIAGRVVTARFTSGTNGGRTVTLAGGELVATAANDDFFRGIEVVRLEGEATIANEENVTVRSGLIGPGGFVKAGAGTLTVGGYAAWAGKTKVEAGTLDMNGGMVMGGIEIAEGASVVNAKYDDIDTLSFEAENWYSGTASTRPYLQIIATKTASASSAMRATDANGELKGAISFAAADDGMAFRGWTAFGWTDLRFADGTAVAAGASCDLQMRFDFNGKQYYVFYYAKRGDDFERLVSADGLTAFPVAGALASVKTFDGTGLQLTVDDAIVSRWIGGPSGKWNVAANWSSSSVPKRSARAFVDTPATIDVAGFELDSPVAILVANAHVTFTGGTLKFVDLVRGAGTLVLSNATLTAGTSRSLIELPVESVVGTDNALERGEAVMNGALKGAGNLTAQMRFCGDTRDFAGTVTLLDGGIGSATAAGNARSVWNVAGFPFGVSDLRYEFGALNGSFAAEAGDAKNVTLVVGARDEHCQLSGSWFAGTGSGIEWTAKTAVLDYDVANTAFVRLIGGGKVVLGSSASALESISFRDNGGTIAFADGVSFDPSAVIRNSTAPVAFDDGGKNCTWRSALDASNVGGFVKRGAGTLTLDAVPKYSGVTAVEEGTLVVPFGTRLDALNISRNGKGKVILDMGNATQNGVAFSAGSANRDLTEKYFSITNGPSADKLKWEVNANRGIVISVGSSEFVWTGKVDNKWENKSNWTVNNESASRYPAEQDDVLFGETTAVAITTNVVCNIRGEDGLCVQGSNAVLSVVGSLRLPGLLTLDGNVALDAADMDVSSLAGTGTITVASRALTLSQNVESSFVGTLNVTNFVKAGEGDFEYEPLSPFAGTMAVRAGALRWNCANGNLTNQTDAALTLSAGTKLDLCGKTVTVGSFKGAGTVKNGILVTADGIVTQCGGALEIPAVDQTTYVASQAGEQLSITEADGKTVRIVIPRTWFAAGVSGKNAVRCDKGANIIWDIQSKTAVEPKWEGDDCWSIGGGGFTIRLK